MKNTKYNGGVIFRAWKTHPKTGEKMYARDYGKRAWPIPISDLDAKRSSRNVAHTTEQ